MSKQNKTFKDRRLEELVKNWNKYFRIGKDGSLELEFTETSTGIKEWRKPSTNEILDFFKQFLSETIDIAEKEGRKQIYELINNLKRFDGKENGADYFAGWDNCLDTLNLDAKEEFGESLSPNKKDYLLNIKI